MPLIYIILLVVLIVLLVGSLPHWPYAASWGTGYYAPGLFGILLIVLLILLLTGRL